MLEFFNNELDDDIEVFSSATLMLLFQMLTFDLQSKTSSTSQPRRETVYSRHIEIIELKILELQSNSDMTDIWMMESAISVMLNATKKEKARVAEEECLANLLDFDNKKKALEEVVKALKAKVNRLPKPHPYSYILLYPKHFNINWRRFQRYLFSSLRCHYCRC